MASSRVIEGDANLTVAVDVVGGVLDGRGDGRVTPLSSDGERNG